MSPVWVAGEGVVNSVSGAVDVTADVGAAPGSTVAILAWPVVLPLGGGRELSQNRDFSGTGKLYGAADYIRPGGNAIEQ